MKQQLDVDESIAVIGGGISGLFLAHENQKLGIRTNVYEASSRAGGKYQTDRSHGINREFGAIRFEWGLQPRLESLVHELACEVQTFPAFCGDTGQELVFISKVCQLLWSMKTGTAVCMEQMKLDTMKANIETVGETKWLPYKNKKVYPHEVYINEWLADYDPSLLREMEMILESIRAFFIEDDTLVLWLLRWTKVLVCNTSIKTCVGGNQSIIEALIDKLPRGTLHYQHKLVRISPVQNSATAEMPTDKKMQWLLHFDDGAEVKTSQVVLAMPPAAIQQLEFPWRPEVQDILATGLRAYTLARIFVYVENAPWADCEDLDSMQNRDAIRLRTREVYYYYNSVSMIGMMMLYFGIEEMEHWRDKAEPEMRRFFEDYGAEKQFSWQIRNIETVFWDGSNGPFAFRYLNKIDPNYAMDAMIHAAPGIAIVGDSFSFDPGFTEGALDHMSRLMMTMQSTRSKLKLSPSTATTRSHTSSSRASSAATSVSPSGSPTPSPAPSLTPSPALSPRGYRR